MNITHLLKVASAWISIVYIICYAGVAIYPPVRPWFMRYALHSDTFVQTNYLSLTTFIAGLIIWNVVAVLAVWLFAALYNSIKK